MRKIYVGDTKEEIEICTEEELKELLPHILPAGWQTTTYPEMPQARWYFVSDGLKVCASVQRERDGKRWMHVSCSRENRLPTWAELRTVKEVIIGRDKLALQVLPPRDQYVNYHPNCLHLWSCLDGDPVPDFARGGMI